MLFFAVIVNVFLSNWFLFFLSFLFLFCFVFVFSTLLPNVSYHPFLAFIYILVCYFVSVCMVCLASLSYRGLIYHYFCTLHFLHSQ